MGDERLKSLRNVAFSSASWNRCSEHDMIASMKVFVVYSSPAGSTARIARRIADFFRKGGTEEFSVSLYDLGALKFYNEGNKISPLLKEIDAAGENGLLFLGSPVYVGHAVPPVSNFIDLLPSDIGTVFVPFVTWGGVSSGVALQEMAESAFSHGLRVAGGISMVAPHSHMWRDDNPLGKARPNKNDMEMLDRWLFDFVRRLATSALSPESSIEALIHPDPVVRESFSRVDLASAADEMPDRTIRTEGANACTLCRSCYAVCPTSAIQFAPHPVFTDRCIYCFNCVKLCPNGSIVADLVSKERFLHKTSLLRNEPASPRFVFLT
ncbi:NAD(P)H-dependent oxidoreductase [Sediminispirochaeta smaragdinae]|uniref:4Fe-4S ferredoxin iron-sulfur binding domain protein n=1 Tax=Sediminispirochaeta smaragdinae (strain DSM 11293 / JCM 15392 / SEBR 4228) TaxID=573413 RepID=E1RB63_SEDSS|nr:NAD(P)H-dependent oxidoreductase [Sediminispirochaeta smaragdinae]ADK79593.1 4Fe-4S ferredoxin iron-sulfur binding domain protein [Sediminispirochaeta smaragdinae DSM 11293]